ncbi:flagellar hook-associated protein FlgK [Saccharobesus litoralis]|uniref:Flagellar hook-associated protein 1 n=1 Tax=Saccharobesus litoralis TaxID=2172099 RepID=A0A2S0VUR5_9ALTE|nr:flagellar hook-associated protein FlgK [Saccharobesus litoralis]AWB67948.1 flagellar hook-associated protein FlgK [Saccharobesus litoralis]
MSSELLKLGTSALLGNQSHLQTVSNNIANLNTPGYSRQRTEFTSYVEWGLGRSETVRLFDKFANDQYRRDLETKGRTESFSKNTDTLDNLFADDQTSIAQGLDDVFGRLNEANDEPSALTPRQLVISDSQALVARMQSLSERVLEQEDIVNEEIDLTISEVNSLIASFYDINEKVVAASAGENNDASSNMLDERNQIIRELSEIIGVNTINVESDGIELVAPNGQPLSIDGAYFNLRTTQGDPDPERLQIEVYSINNPNNVSDFAESNAGGKLGGLLDYRREVLDETINSLGQMAIAFSDAMNQQNRKGVDLEGNLGSDMFSIPSTNALGYRDNSSNFHDIEVRIEDGQGASATNFEYEVVFTSSTEYTVQALKQGEAYGSASGPFTIPGNTTDFQGSSDGLPDGLELRFDPDSSTASGGFTTGDTFLLRPSRLSGLDIEMNFDRPEQLALAAPISVNNPLTNLGSGRIELTDITDTNTDNTSLNQTGFTDDVNGDGTTGDYGLDADAPSKVVYTLAGQYEVQDSTGAVIGTVASGENIMQQLRDAGTWPTATHGEDYPGYEITVDGQPRAGDEFNIEFNSDGFDDNFNGLKLAELQQADTMRRNILSSSGNTLTFAESYSNLIGFVGDTANRASIAYESSQTLLAQSKLRVDDMSGVNLDEEAADLVRYEQAYSAAARVITVAQTTFDSILQAVRG